MKLWHVEVTQKDGNSYGFEVDRITDIPILIITTQVRMNAEVEIETINIKKNDLLILVGSSSTLTSM